MDWRHNQWVGVGAAVCLIVGIALVFLYMGGTGTPSGVGSGMNFQCESTSETFKVLGKDLEKWEVYDKYFNKPNQAVACKVCGKDDAYWSYYCPTCQQWYKFRPQDVNVDLLLCPKEHEIEVR
jgi:hypothetical protein